MRYLLLLLLLITTTLASTIGTISSVRGKVLLTHLGKVTKATIGTTLEKGDVLKTGKRAKMQVILADKTVITIGRDSEFEVEKYFFEQGNKESNVKLNYKKGFFKTITGKIGKIAPKQFTIKTKNSTIGIRGTQLLNMIDPIKNIETTACTQGVITVAPDTGGPALTVNASQMVDVSAQSGAGPVKKFTAKAQARIRAGFQGKKNSAKENTKEKVESKTEKSEKKNSTKEKTENKSSTKSSDAQKQEGTQTKEEKSDSTTTPSSSDNASPKEEAPAAVETPATEEALDVDAVTVEEEEVFIDTSEIEGETALVEETLSNDITQVVTDEITQEVVQEVEQVIEAVTDPDPIDTTAFEGTAPTVPEPLPEFNPF